MCEMKCSNDSLTRGCVVKSKSGHDAGSFYAVVSVQGGLATIADGRRRKLEKPKRKNIRHLAKTNTVLHEDELATDHKLRRALWDFNFDPDSSVAPKRR